MCVSASMDNLGRGTGSWWLNMTETRRIEPMGRAKVERDIDVVHKVRRMPMSIEIDWLYKSATQAVAVSSSRTQKVGFWAIRRMLQCIGRAKRMLASTARRWHSSCRPLRCKDGISRRCQLAPVMVAWSGSFLTNAGTHTQYGQA